MFGNDSITRGEWILNTNASIEKSLSQKIDFLICMAFIGIKMVVRKNTKFLGFLASKYDELRKDLVNLKVVKNDNTLKTVSLILSQLKYVTFHDAVVQ